MLIAFALFLPSTVWANGSAESAKPSDLRWNSRIVRIALSSSLFQPQIGLRPGSDVEGALERSFKTWEAAANIKFVVTTTDNSTVSPAGKSGDGVSLVTIAPTAENLLFFAGDAEEVPARTRVFYNGKDAITEADIVLNPYQQFSTDGSAGTFDLESTLTHEIGHLLGLEHSFIIGATMQINQGRNGIYGLPAIAGRSLSEDDIAGVRAIYGPPAGVENCCGSISGEIQSASVRSHVWLEELSTGRVIAGTDSDSEARFSISGLTGGEYKLYSKPINLKGGSSVNDSGTVQVEAGKSIKIPSISSKRSSKTQLSYLGFSGQLSRLPVPVNGGKSFIIYIGGSGITEDSPDIFFNSPFLSISRGSLIRHDFSSDLSVFSFEISLSSDVPPGDYSIYYRAPGGSVDALPGGLSVGEVVNNWNSFQIPVN